MHTNNTISTKRPGPIRPAVESATIRAVLPFIDHISYGHKRQNGDISQVSRNRLDTHYHAVWEYRFCGAKLNANNLVHELNGNDICLSMRSGESQLLVRSYWGCGWLLIRFDIDAHKGQTDAWAALNMLRNDYLPQISTFGSEGGCSGYLWLKVPTWLDKETGEEKPACTIVEMNNFRKLIHERVKALLQSKGFEATGEVHGSFLGRTHDNDEHGVPQSAPVVSDGALGIGTNVKLPRFSTLDEVKSFSAAKVECNPRLIEGPIRIGTDTGLLKLLDDGKLAVEEVKAKQADENFEKNKQLVLTMSDERIADAIGWDVPLDLNNRALVQQIIDFKPSRGTARSKLNRIITPAKPDDKRGMTMECLVRAGLLLNIHRAADFASRQHEIIELAHQLYIENNLSLDHRDKERDQRFLGVYKWLLRKYDDAKAGGGGNDENWIDSTHVSDVERKLISTPAVTQAIKDFNASPSAKHCKLNVHDQAWVLLAMGKNSVTGTVGDVPTKSIRNLLAHPNCLGKVLHNSAIKAYMHIACTFTGAIEKIADAVRPHFDGIQRVLGRAARYVIRKLNWFTFLPQPPSGSSSDTARSAPYGAIVFNSEQYRGDLTHDAEALYGCDPTYESQETSDFVFAQKFVECGQFERFLMAGVRTRCPGDARAVYGGQQMRKELTVGQ